MEVNQIIRNFNNTKCDFPEDKCIFTLFEEQVDKTPSAIALECGNESLTFKELNTRANQLANFLRKSGVGPDVLVGVCIERSIEMIVCLFGILKAGGAYVPIDPKYPKERITYLLNDSKVPILLTHPTLKPHLKEFNSEIIYIDKDWKQFEGEDKENLSTLSSSTNLAYIIYTSGSTGNPKGVMGIHKASVNRFNWMWNNFPFDSAEKCCQKTSLSFVDSIWEIFGPLLKGITLVIISDEILKDNYLFVKNLSVKNISRMVLVPSLLKVILEIYEDAGQSLLELKYWFCSGEPLPIEIYKNFNSLFPLSKLINLYGSSEVAADVTIYDTKNIGDLDYVPIGKPIDNCEVYILNSDLNLVEPGEPGELHIAGECLARGYLYRPELTSEKFIPNPIKEANYSTLYKTGDIVKFFDDGNIKYLGRTDQQVKIRGYRIELGEVEAAINKLQYIKESVVVAEENEINSKYLKAYLVPTRKHEISISNIRQFLGETLPDFMIPSQFIFLEQIPLTPNGKVDRSGLSRTSQINMSRERDVILPSTSTEEALLEIWTEVLDKLIISVDDNFFEIGGHSLAATKIISRIRNAFDIEFPLKKVFENPNIRELANEIEEIIFKEIHELSEEEANKLINQE